MVLDGLPGLYGFKYDSATACGLPLYLYSYKLVGSATSSFSYSGFISHLLQMTSSTSVATSIAFSRLGMKLDRWARSLLVLVPDNAFVGHD